MTWPRPDENDESIRRPRPPAAAAGPPPPRAKPWERRPANRAPALPVFGWVLVGGGVILAVVVMALAGWWLWDRATRADTGPAFQRQPVGGPVEKKKKFADDEDKKDPDLDIHVNPENVVMEPGDAKVLRVRV